MARDRLGPPGYRQAASFGLDEEAQTFVELEGGGKEAFTRMMRDGLYAAYTWRVRHFAEGQTNETTIRFTPDGQPVRVRRAARREAPGRRARQPRPRAASARRRRARAGRCDVATLRARRAGAGAAAGRPRRSHLHLRAALADARTKGATACGWWSSGDRLTAVRHFVKIPEAFTRRYENMRSANEAIGVGVGRRHGPALRVRRHRRRPVLHAAPALGALAASRSSGASRVAFLQALACDQRVAAALDVVRHGGAAHDVLRPAGRDDRA